jgi:tetratricopeptide (TPR) repeat protein
MRKPLNKLTVVICFFCILHQSHAQITRLDSLKQVALKEKDPSKQFRLYQLVATEAITSGNTLDALPAAMKLIDIALALKNDSLLMRSYMAMAVYFDYRTEPAQTIAYQLKALRIAEEKFPADISRAYQGIGAAYIDLNDYTRALANLRKSLQLAHDKAGRQGAGIYMQLSRVFVYTGQYDSALIYANRSNEWCLANPGTALPRIVSGLLGVIYHKLGKDELAQTYFTAGLDPAGRSVSYVDAMNHQEYGSFLLDRNRLAEAKHHGLKAIQAAKYSHSKKPLLESVSLLHRIYARTAQTDSAYYYAQAELTYRDSIFRQENLSTIQNLELNETIRAREILAKQVEQAEERSRNLQYAGIAFGLVAFVIIFFLFSHSIMANEKLIRFLGVIALLIVFEFLNLLLHPWIGSITHHSPVLMLLAMVIIAALLVPLHHRMQHWITYKLTERNKKIKLAAAKRTIAQLEREGISN